MRPSILFVMHMPPPVHGAAMMGKYIHDSRLINESFDCHYINLTTARSLEDIGHFRLGKITDFVRLLRNIRKQVKKLHPDLVYVTPNSTAPAFYKDFFIVQMLKSMGCKVVLHYHNKGVATRQGRWLDDKFYTRFFRNVKVILLAEALYPDVKKYVKREDAFVCPNGIPEEINVGAKQTLSCPHILFLSNLLIDKGVLVLLDALRILKEEGIIFFCDFVGGETKDFDQINFSREVEKRGLDEMVEYHGKRYGKDKDKLYASADIFTLPSFNEAFPLVILEAMSHALPVVATNVGGILSEIEDGKTGYICKARDAVSLAECLRKLLVDQELRTRMGEAALRKFQQEFTLEAFEKNMKSILSACINA
ncbi:MAG: glycosyltransferase family 4 protein [Prevotella sp.]|nr:glycosyltransferase family 4 protein [Prevotella sp.]